jgi:hypothetical protein
MAGTLKPTPTRFASSMSDLYSRMEFELDRRLVYGWCPLQKIVGIFLTGFTS